MSDLYSIHISRTVHVLIDPLCLRFLRLKPLVLGPYHWQERVSFLAGLQLGNLFSHMHTQARPHRQRAHGAAARSRVGHDPTRLSAAELARLANRGEGGPAKVCMSARWPPSPSCAMGTSCTARRRNCAPTRASCSCPWRRSARRYILEHYGRYDILHTA